MTICDRQGLKQTAASRLASAAYSPRRLMLIHTGVSLGAGVLLSVLSLALNSAIANTGGLSGIGTRSILTTLQSFLQLAVTVLLPFWEIGMIYTATRLARGESAEPIHLTRGFGRIGPVLVLNLLRGFLLGFLAVVCANVSSILIGLTPFAKSMMEVMTPLIEQIETTGTVPVLDDATVTALFRSMLPMFILTAVLYLVAAVFAMYRLRFADYVIVDEPRVGAIGAMLASWRMTRGKLWGLVKLDLSFWWFYGLYLLLTVLSYGDWILGAVGVSLPMSPEVASLMFYGLHVLGMLALYGHSGIYLQTTYAVLYDSLHTKPEVPALPKEN